MKKKILIFITVAILALGLLAGCSPETNTGIVETNKGTKEPEERIQLTLDNYSDYIAKYNYVVLSDSSTTTYWNFYGSTLCRFDDVTLTYTYSTQEEINSGKATYSTLKLTISGCGQIRGATSSRYGGSIATITKITGYVVIL